MNDTLDLPPIEAPAMPVATQPAAPEPGTLKATALASFVAIRNTSPCVGTMGAGQAADAAPAAEPLPAPVARSMAAVFDACVPMPAPTMTLGDLNAWLSPLRIESAGLESLGFPAAARRKAALLYHDTDKAAMVAAMVKHLQRLAA